MKAFIVVLLIAVSGVVGYFAGEMYGSARVLSDRTIDEYLYGNNEKCDDLYRNEQGKLICEVEIEAEDDAVFIIKKKGAHDDHN